MSAPRIEITADRDAWTTSVRATFLSRIAARRPTTPLRCALTGGSAAKHFYGSLAGVEADWRCLTLFWGDERAVPSDHPDSNYRLSKTVWLDEPGLKVSNVHRMPADSPDLDRACADYEAALRPGGLDLVHLGMGPDGHVCSLFPGHRLMHQQAHHAGGTHSITSDPWVAWLDDSPKPPAIRMTLTQAALASSRELWFLIVGETKAVAVKEALGPAAADSMMPAAIISRHHSNVTWYLDAGAASLL